MSIVGLVFLIVGIVILLFILFYLLKWVVTGFSLVKEKEVMIIERFGKYHSMCTPGINWTWPFIDRFKVFTFFFFYTSRVITLDITTLISHLEGKLFN